MNSIIVIITRLLVCILSIYSKIVCSIYIAFGKSYKKSLTDFIAEHKLNQKSPESLQEWVRLNYTYREDFVDYAKDYRVFMYDRCGDCDDFAEFFDNLLPLLGYENVHIVTVMADNKYGHSMCVATLNNVHYGFGNWKLKTFTENSLNHIGEIVARVMDGKLWFVLKYVKGSFDSSLSK